MFQPSEIYYHAPEDVRDGLTAKLLDASREYWGKRGVLDWGIVVEEGDGGDV